MDWEAITVTNVTNPYETIVLTGVKTILDFLENSDDTYKKSFNAHIDDIIKAAINLKENETVAFLIDYKYKNNLFSDSSK